MSADGQAQEALINIARDLGLGIAGGPDDIRAEIMVAVQAMRGQACKDCDNLRRLLRLSLPHVEASAGASHLLDGFRRQARPLDALVEEIRAALTTEGAQA